MGRDADLPLFFLRIAPALGVAYTLAGRIADAVPLLTQALERACAMAWASYEAHCRLSLGAAQMLAGRLEEAQGLAERTLALVRAHQERGHQAYALHLLGEIAARHAPLDSEHAEAS
jgi:tetratricopeptide (TPR) repeat protein